MGRLFAGTDPVRDADAAFLAKKKTGRMGIGVLAACLMGLLMGAPAAQAELQHATLTATGGLLDTFTIESDGGFQLPGDLFAINNDDAGFTAATFRDLNDGSFGTFGTGTSPANFNVGFANTFLPSIYDGTPAASCSLKPGTYDDFCSALLTLTVPEPATWTLMIAGAMAIGAMQVGRRRRRLATA